MRVFRPLFVKSQEFNLVQRQFEVSGHGTYVDNEEVIASVAGTIERVNKLVTVRPIRSRCGSVPCN